MASSMGSELSEGFVESLDAFSRKLYHQLVNLNPNKNLICSTFAIQSCAAMLRMGAEDDSVTAQELDEKFNFHSSDAAEISKGFATVLNTYKQYISMHLANKLYIMQGYQPKKKFNEILTQKFLSPPEIVDFSSKTVAAFTMNSWVETRTNNIITNLVNPDILNDSSRLVLVNAIHFKGEWTIKFNERATRSEDFFLDDSSRTKVPMMNETNEYYYTNLPNLDAKALRMSFKHSSLHFLIILPNTNSNLSILERSLETTPLEDITSKLIRKKVKVKLPKFKIEFEQELTPVFMNLGIENIFTDQAEFEKMTMNSTGEMHVSKIIHKSLIEITEEGTEAALPTSMSIMFVRMSSLDAAPELFYANHPFYYTIYDANHGRLFVGNIRAPLYPDDVYRKPDLCPCESRASASI